MSHCGLNDLSERRHLCSMVFVFCFVFLSYCTSVFFSAHSFFFLCLRELTINWEFSGSTQLNKHSNQQKQTNKQTKTELIILGIRQRLARRRRRKKPQTGTFFFRFGSPGYFKKKKTASNLMWAAQSILAARESGPSGGNCWKTGVNPVMDRGGWPSPCLLPTVDPHAPLSDSK